MSAMTELKTDPARRGIARPSISAPPRFEDHLKQVLQGIRGALTELVASVGADPQSPQDLARRFGLNKNLTWKLTKIINSTGLVSIIQHLPGRPGLSILLRTMAEQGAPKAALQQVSTAMQEFEDMVVMHCGDRATLDLMISSRVRDNVELRETSRKLAFQGNSAIWGVQSRVRLATHVVGPSGVDRERLDVASIGGVIDHRRLRPAATCPFYRSHIRNDDGSEVRVKPEPLDPTIAGDEVPFLADFCSSPLPKIQAISESDGLLYELCEGPVGNTAAITCILGFVTRAAFSRYRDETNVVGAHLAPITAPSEALVFDLFLHEDLSFEMPRASIHTRLAGSKDLPLSQCDRDVLPVLESVQELGNGLTVIPTPLIPTYPEMIGKALDRLGWKAQAFRGYRFLMRYPPVLTVAVLRYALHPRS